MGSKTRIFEMTRADQRHAHLLRLALSSIGEDYCHLVGGSEITEDRLSPTIWGSKDETSMDDEIKRILRDLRQNLDALGFRVLLFAASESYLEGQIEASDAGVD